jgi:hypothetical protein
VTSTLTQTGTATEFDGVALTLDEITAAAAYVFPHASAGRGQLDLELIITEDVTDQESAERVAAEVADQVLTYLSLHPKYRDGDERTLAAIFVRVLRTGAQMRYQQNVQRLSQVFTAGQLRAWIGSAR